MRFFICFSYNGTAYHGSQFQPNAHTVQEELERKMQLILRMPITLTFAGRTDTGVHAEQMWAHFDYPDTDFSLPQLKPLPNKLNGVLPQDIRVHSIRHVCDDAHARFSARTRTYQYRIIHTPNPFFASLCTRVPPGIDIKVMNDIAQLIIGQGDFASFAKTHTDVKTTLCHIYEAYWKESFLWNGAPMTVFQITADRFLRNMIRALVGTMLDAGKGKISISDFKDIWLAHDRRYAKQSAPAQGLYLTHISYPPHIFLNP